MPLVMLHQSQVQLQPGLIYEIPIQTWNQLRISHITDLQKENNQSINNQGTYA